MEPAPNFHLLDQDGKPHSLTDFQGKWLVLYFYPEDDTPGCTTEACAFRDAHESLAALPDVDVVGVSTDSIESHKRFANKYHLDFELLSDPDHQVIEAYDSWKPLKVVGREYFGTKRNTFLINPQGQIEKSYTRVDPNNHVDQILNDLARLSAS